MREAITEAHGDARVGNLGRQMSSGRKWAAQVAFLKSTDLLA
jgi:hypothetical protein